MTRGARRCDGCDVNWPDLATKFGVCPVCSEDTHRVLDIVPLNFIQAENLCQEKARERDETRERHEEFNRYYVETRKEEINREVAQLHAELDAFTGAT